MADADVRAEARDLLDALRSDSSAVNPATGTTDNFNEETATNTSSLVEQVDEIIKTLPIPKTPKEEREDLEESAKITGEATADAVASSINPALGLLTKVSRSIFGVVGAITRSGFKLGTAVLGFRAAMAAFDEFMQPGQTIKERILSSISAGLVSIFDDVATLLGFDVDIKASRKKVNDFLTGIVDYFANFSFEKDIKPILDNIRDFAKDLNEKYLPEGKDLLEFFLSTAKSFKTTLEKISDLNSNLMSLASKTTIDIAKNVLKQKDIADQAADDLAVSGTFAGNVFKNIASGLLNIFGTFLNPQTKAALRSITGATNDPNRLSREELLELSEKRSLGRQYRTKAREELSRIADERLSVEEQLANFEAMSDEDRRKRVGTLRQQNFLVARLTAEKLRLESDRQYFTEEIEAISAFLDEPISKFTKRANIIESNFFGLRKVQNRLQAMAQGFEQPDMNVPIRIVDATGKVFDLNIPTDFTGSGLGVPAERFGEVRNLIEVLRAKQPLGPVGSGEFSPQVFADVFTKALQDKGLFGALSVMSNVDNSVKVEATTLRGAIDFNPDAAGNLVLDRSQLFPADN